MTRFILTAAVACLFTAATVQAEDAATADTGLCKGDSIGAFYVEKVGGAEDDGVDAGEALCYRCRYGTRPMVMVFARETGPQVAKLVNKLDNAVGKNSDAQLRGLVTILGAEASQLKESAAKLAGATSPKNVPIVIAKDAQSGPGNYKLNADTDITIVVASDSQVIARHEFKADAIDIAAVMSEVKSMLN